MNRRRTVAVVVTLLALTLGRLPLRGQEDPKQRQLSAVIDKAIKAHGGEEALSKLKAQVWKDKGVSFASGKETAFAGSYAFQVPDQITMELRGASTFSLRFNRDKGWMNGKELTPAQVEQQKEYAYIGWVTSCFPLKDKALTLTLLDDAVVGGRPAAGIRIRSQGHRDIDIYFDKETGLMAKTVTRMVGMVSGTLVEQESLRSAYKVFDGIPVPMKYVVTQGGKKFMEGEVTEWRRADGLDDAVFTPTRSDPVSR